MEYHGQQPQLVWRLHQIIIIGKILIYLLMESICYLVQILERLDTPIMYINPQTNCNIFYFDTNHLSFICNSSIVPSFCIYWLKISSLKLFASLEWIVAFCKLYNVLYDVQRCINAGIRKLFYHRNFINNRQSETTILALGFADKIVAICFSTISIQISLYIRSLNKSVPTIWRALRSLRGNPTIPVLHLLTFEMPIYIS